MLKRPIIHQEDGSTIVKVHLRELNIVQITNTILQRIDRPAWNYNNPNVNSNEFTVEKV